MRTLITPKKRRNKTSYIVFFLAFVSLASIVLGGILFAANLNQSNNNLKTAFPKEIGTLASPSVTPIPQEPELTPSPSSPTTPVVLYPLKNISIPVLDVSAPIVPVGIKKDLSLEIPDDINLIGWYRFASHPEDKQGSTVLVGHRDGVNQGHGAFYSIGLLKENDIIRVSLENSQIFEYKVSSVRLLDKTEFKKAAKDLFSTIGAERLTLISCGGYYDSSAGGYQANIIVTAVSADL